MITKIVDMSTLFACNLEVHGGLIETAGGVVVGKVLSVGDNSELVLGKVQVTSDIADYLELCQEVGIF